MMQLFIILLPSLPYYLLPVCVCVCETLHWIVMCMCKAMRGGTVQVQLVRVLYRNTAPSFGSKPQNHNTHDRKTQADNMLVLFLQYQLTSSLPSFLPGVHLPGNTEVLWVSLCDYPSYKCHLPGVARAGVTSICPIHHISAQGMLDRRLLGLVLLEKE